MVEDSLPQDLQDMKQKIASAKGSKAASEGNADEGKRSEFISAARIGLRVGTEMLSAVLIGGAIGYSIDKWLETQPIFLVAFLILGGAAGILNIYRFAKDREATNK